MDKNRFYKELMSEYSFNSERIKANAKRGRYARRNNLPMYIGITAAAAVCTVAIGTGIMMMASDNGVSLVQTDGLAALSASDRLKRDLEEIEQKADSKELYDIFVTFGKAYTPAEAQNVLTAYSETVMVKRVYYADGTQAVGEQQVKAAFSSNGAISGAVINCEGALMKQLLDDPRVYSVNIIGENDDLDSLIPVSNEDSIPAQIPNGNDPTPAVPTEPATDPVGSEPVSGETDETGEPESGEESSESFESGEETTEPESTETTETESGETSEPEVITPAEPDEPAPTITDASLPAGVVLPETVSKLSYTITDIAAEQALFIGDNMMYVKTADTVSLYHFNGTGHRLAVTEDCSDARVVWVAENGGRMIVSGVGENGSRNRLLYIDAAACTITDMNAEDTVLDGTMTSVGFNADENILAMVIKEYGTYYVCTTSVNSDKTLRYLSTSFTSETKPTLLAAAGGYVYLAVNDGQLTQIYKADVLSDANKLIKTYDNNPVISKNLAFTHAVIAPAENAVIGFTEIFDSTTESFIRTDLFNEGVTFGVSKHCYTADGAFYNVSGGTITTTGNVYAISRIDYKKSLSSLYTAAVSDGVITITDSPYFTKGSGELVVGSVSDNCSAELRKAANKALAMHNALALGLCRDSGISDLDMLSDCINALYTQGAAAQLKRICDIGSYGELRYNGTRLSAADVSGMVLVISSESADSAQGRLYLRTGTLGGKPAYYARNVSFKVEDNVWKMDCVLN